MSNLYEDLGVPETAAPEEIKKAHRRKVRKAHPDAGGKREEFDKVQRAYLVLIDPEKRAHYDETGAIDDMPANLVEQQAIAALGAKLSAVLGMLEQDPRFLDVPKAIRSMLAEDRRAAKVNKAQNETFLKRVEEFKKRLKVKEGKPDHLLPILENHVAGLRQAVQSCEKGIEVLDVAEAIIETFLYELDVDPATMAPGRTVLRGFYLDT